MAILTFSFYDLIDEHRLSNSVLGTPISGLLFCCFHDTANPNSLFDHLNQLSTARVKDKTSLSNTDIQMLHYAHIT